MVSGMEIINLFPTPIMRFHLGELTEAEKAYFETACGEQVQNIGNTTSKDRTLLYAYALKGLRKKIDEALAAYVQHVIAPQKPVNMRITQSWLNVTRQGQFHHRHAHPGSLVSGVYYVEAGGEHDRIMFHRSGYERIKFPTATYNPWNSQSWWIPVKTGDLILFPSEQEHSVPNLETSTRRVSLAFNSWCDGESGSWDDLTHLVTTVSGPYAVADDRTGAIV